MKLFQRLLSAAKLFTSLHVLPSLCASSITDLLQVFFGLPLFLVPWGFQSNAILSTAFSSFLIVCPIHFHVCFLIWIYIGFSPVVSHSIILLITSGHHTFNLRRQWFIKDCSFCLIEFVTFQVLQPYNKTAFTLLLKIFNLVFILIFLFFQILYSSSASVPG
jgi:hypothetical protein